MLILYIMKFDAVQFQCYCSTVCVKKILVEQEESLTKQQELPPF